MSQSEYRAALDRLGFTQHGFARLAGVIPRTAEKWALGETRVPGSVALILRLLLARPELLSVVAEMPPSPARTRKPARARA